MDTSHRRRNGLKLFLGLIGALKFAKTSNSQTKQEYAIPLHKPTVICFEYLKTISGETNTAIVIALDTIKDIKSIAVAGHYPKSTYSDGQQRGDAEYSVTPIFDVEDGYTKIHVSGKQLNLEHTYELKTGCWGITGSSDDKTDGLKAMAKYAKTVVQEKGHAVIRVEKGLTAGYGVIFGLNVHIRLDHDAEFYGIVDRTDFNPDTPCFTFGAYEDNTENATIDIAFRCKAHIGIAKKNAIGIRCVNFRRSTFNLRNVSGCATPLQLAGSGDGNYFGYNIIYGGDLNFGTYLLSLHSMIGSGVSLDPGWVNENTFIKTGFRAGSSMEKEGSCRAITTTCELGGYSGSDKNVFIDPVMELGKAAHDYGYYARTALLAGERINAEGREYEADVDMLSPDIVPIHLNGTASGLKYVGFYRRTPMLFDRAGSNYSAISIRLEGCYGEFLIANAAEDDCKSGDKCSLHFLHMSGIKYPENYSGNDIYTNPPGRVHATTSTVSLTERDGEIAKPYWIKNFQDSFIYSSDVAGWHSTIARIGTFAGELKDIAASTTSADGIRLTKNGVYCRSAYGTIALVLDSTKLKTFDIGFNKEHTPMRMIIYAYDEDMNLIEQSDSSNGVTQQSVRSTYLTKGLSDIATYRTRRIVSCRKEVKRLSIVIRDIDMNEISVAPVKISYDTYDHEVKVITGNSVAGFSDKQRTSPGIPTYGHFPIAGEVISSLIDDRQWIVRRRGVIAPEWLTETAYVKNQLVTNGDRTYFAESAGISGGILPSHAADNSSDGSINWIFHSNIPLIRNYIEDTSLNFYTDDGAAGSAGLTSGDRYIKPDGSLMIKL